MRGKGAWAKDSYTLGSSLPLTCLRGTYVSGYLRGGIIEHFWSFFFTLLFLFFLLLFRDAGSKLVAQRREGSS